jgi:hypothetical protein
MSKLLGCALAALFVLSSTSAFAQRDLRALEFEAHRLHVECDHGDRRACVRFGILLGENRERHEEWRHAHPEFFWFER